MNNHIDSVSFDKKLGGILKTKEGKNLIKGRFDIESIQLKHKADFLISFISLQEEIFSITYKILFWEKDEVIERFFNLNFSPKQYKINKTYRGGKLPGSVFVDESGIDKIFLKTLLDSHFNYEMAKEPSLNIRVQLCINVKDIVVLLDIYDDRGFYIYYLKL
jgi:hypothetical protein